MTAEGSTAEELFPSGKPLHVLTLTPFYPVREDDAQGCFVAEPLSWLARLGVTNTVRAVQPFYRRLRPRANTLWFRHTRYSLSLPGGWGLSSSGAFLFASLLPEVRRLHGSPSVLFIDFTPTPLCLVATPRVAQP